MATKHVLRPLLGLLACAPALGQAPAGKPAATPAPAAPGPASGPAARPAASAPTPGTAPPPTQAPPPAQLDPREAHLSDLHQLTFGGENAEAYFSFDGQRLSLQATTEKDKCDQIYTLDLGPVLAGGAPSMRRLSDGRGRTTCSHFLVGDSRVLFSSTRQAGDACPPPPDRSKGYVWPLYNYQIYTARPDGSDLRRLAGGKGYDAEATVCRDGSIVFTSDRDGDLELYRMHADGTGLARLTHAPGYDGGAFFSEDCKRIVWRADRPRSDKERAEMKALLGERLVRPSRMELWTADADGSNAHQVTDLGGASFAPYFIPQRLLPKGAQKRRVIFSSNHQDPKHREFDLWAVNDDGSDLERITFSPEFDGFPMFQPGGDHLVFASNRGGKVRGETNLFLATWKAEGPAGKGAAEARVATSADRAARRVAWLADPARQGRGVGTAGLAAAADEVARWMKEAGLQPAFAPPAGALGAGKDKGFFQPVEVFVGVRDAGSSFRLTPPEGQKGEAVALPKEAAAPAPMSESASFSGDTVFAGYGITAPESRWDDLQGVDLKGKVAVVLRGVPEGKLEGRAARSYSDLRYKAWNLREHGARAVAFVDPEKDGVPKLTLDGPEGGAGLPVLFLGRERLDALVPEELRKGGALAALRKAADKGEAKGVHLQQGLAGKVALVREQRRERNVAGVLRAPGPSLGAVVIGAHYDHLGLGGRGSFVPDEKVPHPGADDNASGTTALLETAERLKAARLPLDLYFVAFTGEEVGLVGSSHFVKALPRELAAEKDKGRLRAMINFDMVGRLGSQKGQTLPSLGVQGTDSAAEWPQLISPLCATLGVDCKLGGDGYGPSDMTPFYAAGVPVVFFFTGPHADYHRPSDTAEKINAMGIVQVAQVASGAIEALGRHLQGGAALTFQKPTGPAPRAGDGRGYGAYLGTIPDFTAMQGQKGGVKLTGARPGSPAEAAGVKNGDVLVGLGGKAIDTLEDMAFVLRGLKPGQKTELVLVRDGKRLTSPVTMGQRGAEGQGPQGHGPQGHGAPAGAGPQGHGAPAKQ